MYPSAFPICLCNPSGVPCYHTKSCVNISFDTICSPTLTAFFAAFIANISSLMNALDKVGGSVRPCTIPSKASNCFYILSSTIKALLAYCSIFFTIPHPSEVPVSHTFFHRRVHHTVSQALYTSGEKQYVASPASSVPRIMSPHVCTCSTQRRYGLRPDCPSLILTSFSRIFPTLSLRIRYGGRNTAQAHSLFFTFPPFVLSASLPLSLPPPIPLPLMQWSVSPILVACSHSGAALPLKVALSG